MVWNRISAANEGHAVLLNNNKYWIASEDFLVEFADNESLNRALVGFAEHLKREINEPYWPMHLHTWCNDRHIACTIRCCYHGFNPLLYIMNWLYIAIYRWRGLEAIVPPRWVRDAIKERRRRRNHASDNRKTQ